MSLNQQSKSSLNRISDSSGGGKLLKRAIGKIDTFLPDDLIRPALSATLDGMKRI